jgi:pimeloyl-ACP methyl ester carboxylesterase
MTRYLAVYAVLLTACTHTPQRDVDPMAFTRHIIDRPDGGKLAYYDRPGDGPILVMVPGSWGDWRVFDAVRPDLPDDWRLLIVELPGHGASMPAAIAPSMARFTADVLQAVDAAGIDRFYVTGHSIGGMIAVDIVGARPEAIAGSIPIEGWTHYTVQRNAFGGVPSTLSPSQEAQRLANRRRVLDFLTVEDTQTFARVWRSWNGYNILAHTSVPFLSLWGDRARGPVAQELLQIPDRPNIEVYWMTGASHSLPIERPEEVAAQLRRFIETQE